MSYLTVTDKNPHQYFLLIDSRQQEISINCENIENFSEGDDGKLNLTYMVPQTDFFGRVKTEMERRIEEYECAESVLLINTFNGIR